MQALMPTFAQNYPQLMNQAQQSGLSVQELSRLQAAFEIALEFSHGIYRAQGVPLLNHLITTCSILLVEKQPMDVVIAGLVHAAYTLHLFDDSARSSKIKARRKELRSSLGDDVEILVWEYQHFPWFRAHRIQRYIDEYGKLSELQRKVLSLKLANEVDDYLDYATEYMSFGLTGIRSEECFELCIELADTMQLSTIHQSFQKIISTSISPPNILVRNHKQGYELFTMKWKKGWIEKINLLFLKTARKIKRVCRLIIKPNN